MLVVFTGWEITFFDVNVTHALVTGWFSDYVDCIMYSYTIAMSMSEVRLCYETDVFLINFKWEWYVSRIIGWQLKYLYTYSGKEA